MRRDESGFTLVMLVAGVAIMLILMAAAVPTWKYVMRDAREEELIFRGVQIVDAIERFQRDPRNGNTLPVSLEVLVQGKYLRKAYKDPMTPDGKWRIVHQGEPLAVPGSGQQLPGGQGPGGQGAGGQTSGGASTTRDGRPRRDRPGGGNESTTSGGQTGVPFAARAGQALGPIVGVASNSTDTGLRVVNGRTKYNEWLFVLGQPIIVGKRPVRLVPGAAPNQPQQQPQQPQAQPQ